MKKSIVFAIYGHDYVPKNWGKHFCSGKKNRLYYIHSGTGGYYLNGNKQYFTHNKIYLITGNANVVTFSSPDNPILHTYCDFELLDVFFSPQVCSFVPTTNMEKHALDIFIEGGKIATENRVSDELFTLDKSDANFYTAAVSYLIDIAKNYIKTTLCEDEEILKAIDYMYNNIATKITIDDLAKLCFMSPTGFIKKFKKTTNLTPYAYLKNLRLNMAYYLKEFGLTLEEISEKVGYSDAVALLHAMK